MGLRRTLFGISERELRRELARREQVWAHQQAAMASALHKARQKTADMRTELTGLTGENAGLEAREHELIGLITELQAGPEHRKQAQLDRQKSELELQEVHLARAREELQQLRDSQRRLQGGVTDLIAPVLRESEQVQERRADHG